MTDSQEPVFGFTRTELRDRNTVYAPGLFQDQTVVVTGAGGGLGLAIAALFARLGAAAFGMHTVISGEFKIG